jgi:MFS superfamily sulfate permease-like transporter
LSEEVTFLNKCGILEVLEAHKLQRITIDASRTKSIDQDVLEALQEFKFNAEQEGRPEIIFINL